jgi:serine/threonine protein kinase
LGLSAAHQAGILHRDLKSDNVMLRRESSGKLWPVILDFGLARALNEDGDMASSHSQSRVVAGTISYMAPEQIAGEPLSMATDLYAFGVVWFEMLTGQLPFDRDTPVASMMARFSLPPAAPSSLNAEVPAWVDEIVLRCMTRHRTDRYASAEEVLDEFASRLSSLPSSRTASPRLWRGLIAFTTLAIVGAVVAVGSDRLHLQSDPEGTGTFPSEPLLQSSLRIQLPSREPVLREARSWTGAVIRASPGETNQDGSGPLMPTTPPDGGIAGARSGTDPQGSPSRTGGAGPVSAGSVPGTGGAPPRATGSEDDESRPSASVGSFGKDPDWLPLEHRSGGRQQRQR